MFTLLLKKRSNEMTRAEKYTIVMQIPPAFAYSRQIPTISWNMFTNFFVLFLNPPKKQKFFQLELVPSFVHTIYDLLIN
jgi:hypothetical protein